MNFLKRVIFNLMMFSCWMVAIVISFIDHLLSHKKAVTIEDVDRALLKMQIGDFILTQTKGTPTSWVIPGRYKHLEIFGGGRFSVGAVSPVVRIARIENVLLKCDNFAIMRKIDCTEQQGKEMYDYACKKFLGKKYDMKMNLFDMSTIFCSESGYHAINKVFGPETLVPYWRMGYPTFTPNDCRDAKKVFELIYETKH